MCKDYKNDNWEDFNRFAKNKDIYIFGAFGARYIINDQKKYGNPWNIKGILDNDSKKWGKKYIKGWDVCSPKILLEKDLSNVIVLISGTHTYEMGEQLCKYGVKYYFSELWMSTDMKDFYESEIEQSKVDEVIKILEDDKSKRIVSEIIYKRRNGIMDYSDICSFSKSEYFLDEFWYPTKNEVLVDAGAYTGDTIEEFLEWTKGKYKRIYSFEPQKDKFEYIKGNLWKYVGNENIRLYNQGLWSGEKSVGFIDGDDRVSGRIDLSSNNEVRTVALDNVIQEMVTFIKMDIEGAEIEALKGSEKIIKRDKPKLAISIYHKLDDLWEIPLLIHKMVPEYKFFIRHNGFRCYGTCLYAYIKE